MLEVGVSEREIPANQVATLGNEPSVHRSSHNRCLMCRALNACEVVACELLPTALRSTTSSPALQMKKPRLVAVKLLAASRQAVEPGLELRAVDSRCTLVSSLYSAQQSY